ncbi:MAG: EAL domain-containing protein [Hydrogenophilales bacterium]|nr:EAL domain-containing protein [Hydrogenophilales bacterium]
MRFRSKIVLGVTFIEAILLTVLVASALGWLKTSNEAQIEHRGVITGRLLEAAARDPMIAFDISGLRSLGDDLVASGEIAYVRFLDDSGRTLAEHGPQELLKRPFLADLGMAQVHDDVLDREILMRGGAHVYGRVQFGIQTGKLAAFLAQARRWAISITVIEMVLVVLLSLLLASWLTRRLADLRTASSEVATGNLAHRLAEDGGDELADTARAFNLMTARLLEAHQGQETALTEVRQLASFQHAVLEGSDSAIIVTDTHGTIQHFNPAAARMLGYRAEDVVGKKTPEFFHDPEEVKAHAHLVAEELGIAPPTGFEVFVALARHGLSDRSEWTYITRIGARLPVLTSVSGVYSEDGALLGFMGVSQDVSALKRADERMREAAMVFEASADGIMITDTEGRILTVNPAFSRITGYTSEDALGNTPRLLKSGRHSPKFHVELWQQLRRDGTWEGEIWNRRKNGEDFPAWLSISTVRDAQGNVAEYVVMFSDITVRKQAEEEIRFRAWYDTLTGLPNRNLLDEHLEQALREARRVGHKVAVMFIDLDHFKAINDTLGHAKGDLLLQQAARRLASGLRDSDTLSRQGGDEFVLVLQGVHHAQDAARVADKMIRALAEPFDLDGHQGHIGASVGITLYPDDAQDSSSLYRNADLAMYRAKASGRNIFQFYEASMTEQALKRRDLEIDLRQALDGDTGQLSLHYQAIIDLDSWAVIGTEALVRWNHPQRGDIPPAEFVPLAEETGLIHPLGQWVLETACSEAARLRDAHGLSLPVSINLSSRQVPGALSIETVTDLLAKHGLVGSDLAFEITETLLLGDTQETHDWLQAARAMGIRIDLDDFGTGYSSLAYLKRFTIDRVKVDRSFVRDMTADAGDLTLIQAIMAMAHGLRLEVVAEGIETDAQRIALWQMGCDYGQGYLFARPLPLEQFIERIRAGFQAEPRKTKVGGMFQ